MQYLRTDAVDALKELHRSEQNSGQILLLRGCPSPEWITAVGSKYHIDPEFLHRHLDFFATLVERRSFSLPSVASSSQNIISLTASTVLFRDAAAKQFTKKGNVHARRRADAEEMATYHRRYQHNCRCGDSMVREFSTFDERFSILEQRISICIQRNDRGWIVIIWLDAGRDLLESPSGPWSSEDGSHKHEGFPIIQHHPKMTRLKTSIESAKSSGEEWEHPLKDHDTSSKPSSARRIYQSATLLPFEVDTFLDTKRAATDAFYALQNIFQHVAYSEVQVLNVLESQITQEMGVLTAEHRRSHSLENLQFFTMFLDRHVRQIEDTLTAVKDRSRGRIWPGGPKTRKGGKAKSEAAAERLQMDFEGLLSRALDLRRRCTEGMSVMMNRAVVAESRKAIEQAERVKRLTLLATIFIPLSFVSSLFGMNFREFGQGRLSVWWFVVISAPVLAASYTAYVWDEKLEAPWRETVAFATKVVNKLRRRPDQVV
ncbi:hypothetical protein ACLMJK_006136 [Lecanora helva]